MGDWERDDLFMEDYELDRVPSVVRDFVNRVLALLN